MPNSVPLEAFSREHTSWPGWLPKGANDHATGKLMTAANVQSGDVRYYFGPNQLSGYLVTDPYVPPSGWPVRGELIRLPRVVRIFLPPFHNDELVARNRQNLEAQRVAGNPFLYDYNNVLNFFPSAKYWARMLSNYYSRLDANTAANDWNFTGSGVYVFTQDTDDLVLQNFWIRMLTPPPVDGVQPDEYVGGDVLNLKVTNNSWEYVRAGGPFSPVEGQISPAWVQAYRDHVPYFIRHKTIVMTDVGMQHGYDIDGNPADATAEADNRAGAFCASLSDVTTSHANNGGAKQTVPAITHRAGVDFVSFLGGGPPPGGVLGETEVPIFGIFSKVIFEHFDQQLLPGFTAVFVPSNSTP
jgi:hypothetical protein